MNVIHCEQMTPEWFAHKSGRPSASSAAKLLTSTGKKSTQWKGYLYDLAAERAGYPGHVIEPTEAMLEGIRREGESRNAYAFLTGHKVEEVGLVICDATGASCSPDGLVSGPLGIEHGLELKNPNPGTFFMELDSGRVPAKYIPQLHFSMAVTGLKSWDYCCYLPERDPIIHTVTEDDYTNVMAQAIADFCGELDALCERLEIEWNPVEEAA